MTSGACSLGCTSQQALRAFTDRASSGWRLTSLSSFGTSAAPLHNMLWARTAQPVEQRLDVDVGLAALDDILRRRAEEGLFVASVGMTSATASPVLALLFESAPSSGLEPRFLSPASFCDRAGVFFLHRALAGQAGHALYVRSVACAGVPSNDRGTGLLIAAVLWPQPNVRIASAVHLDAVAPNEGWQSIPSVAVLESAGRPVVALPLDRGKWVVSLWHDTQLTQWPTPNPFAAGSRSIVDQSLGVSFADVLAQVESRSAKRLQPVGVGVSGDAAQCDALVIYGDADGPIPRERHFSWSESYALSERRVDQAEQPAGSTGAASSTHPLDDWMRRKMSDIGARHGQLVITRGGKTPWARAYTFAEPGYPIATLDDAMRLGSVSKSLTTIPLMREILAEGGDLLDDDIFGDSLLAIAAPEDGALPRVSLRDLLTHRAGLRSYESLMPDDPHNPISEDRVAAMLEKADRAPEAGDLRAALQHVDIQTVFGHAPPALAQSEYANEGYVLLGEIVGKRIKNRYGGFAEVMTDLFSEVGAPSVSDDLPARGVMMGRGQAEAHARRESPAHPSSPTWCEDRFGRSDPRPLVLASYGDNGPFLGGAAGLCVPLVWVARLMRAQGVSRFSEPGGWTDERMQLGFQQGPAGYWTSVDGDEKRTSRVVRLHHNGRIEGGCALLVHQAPLDGTPECAAMTILVAFNQLGPLEFEPDGQRLLALLKSLEEDPDFALRDVLEGSPSP